MPVFYGVLAVLLVLCFLGFTITPYEVWAHLILLGSLSCVLAFLVGRISN